MGYVFSNPQQYIAVFACFNARMYIPTASSLLAGKVSTHSQAISGPL